MASTISSLLVALGLDLTDFKSGLADAEKESASVSSRISDGMSNIGGAAVAGIAAVGAAAAAFVASSIGPASDLNETMSKVQVVFGDSAKSVLAFGENAANSLGMSSNAALSAAGTYGNLFRAMGMTEKTSADMSMGLVKLAGDLASFNNMDPTEVLDKLRSGLSGETEPLKSLGVNINEAALKAKALTMGLWDGVAPLTASAKAQATYALVLEQTKLAQGDFARTSDGVANQSRILAANFENLKAKIGAGLLPMLSALSTMLVGLFSSQQFQDGLKIVTDGIANFAQWVIDNIPLVIGAFQAFLDWLNNNQGIVIGILAAIGAAILVWVFTTVIPAVVAFVTAWLPVILVLGAIALAAYLLYKAWTENWGGIQEKTAAVWAWLEPKLAALVDWFKLNIPKALQAVKDFWEQKLLPVFQAIGKWFEVNIPIAIAKLNLKWGELQNRMAMMKAWIDLHLVPLFEGLRRLIGIFLPYAVQGYQKALKLLAPVIQWLKDKFIISLNTQLEILLGLFDAISYFVQIGLTGAFTGITLIIDGVTAAVLALIAALEKLQLPPALGGDATPQAGALNGLGNFSGVLGAQLSADVASGGGQMVVVNYYDQAVVSSANENEIADKLGPAIVNKLRKLGVM